MKLPLYGGGQGVYAKVVGYALVDKLDYLQLMGHRWNLSRGGYAYRRDYTHGRPGVMFYLHRVIMGLKKGDRRQVDHKNRNRLDCRRENLRIVERGQQGHNIFRRGNFSSAYRGVAWDMRTQKWVAYVHCRGKKHNGGYFKDEKEAAKAARRMRKELLSHALD
jgi:HNH endonuclease/AP2 domain